MEPLNTPLSPVPPVSEEAAVVSANTPEGAGTEIDDPIVLSPEAAASQVPGSVLQDGVWLRSLIYFGIATLCFLFIEWKYPEADGRGLQGESPEFIGFILAFICVWVATFDQMVNKRLRWLFFAKKEHYPTFFLLLGTWIVSCFSLNRELPIFQDSCAWLSAVWCVALANFVAFGVRNQMPVPMRQVVTALLAMTSLLALYYTIYLLPVTALGSVVVWFFGISFHAHVPLIIFIALVRQLYNDWKVRTLRFAIVAGLAVPLAFLYRHCNDWYHCNDMVRSAFRDNGQGATAGLPDWVVASQRLQRTARGEQWLKAAVTHLERDSWGWGTGMLENGGIAKVHDPFILISSVFFPEPTIAYDDRSKILKSFYNKRHDLEQRLWSDHSLQTATVQTRVEVYPAQRLAYIEKECTIRSTESHGESQQEAVYTFHLPEGGVVSALSLWVNGVEEKSRLSARSVADSAYKTVVGRERRDPSIVHWQEGNRVTLRVFPCTPKEDRRFKMGVTAPLTCTEKELILENVVFEGPSAAKAKEEAVISIEEGQGKWANAPNFLKQSADGLWRGKRNYKPDMVLRFPLSAGAEATAGFQFMGSRYKAFPYTPRPVALQPAMVYLDINSAWSEKEIKEMLSVTAEVGLPVRIWYEGGWYDPNKWQGYAATLVLKKNHFSLLPFHLIAAPDKALVISKSAGLTPTLSDIKGSVFAKNAEAFFTRRQRPVRCWHIGEDLSDYLRSLRELRLLQVETGDWPALHALLKQGQFYAQPETADTVVIHNSRMCIVRSTDTVDTASEGSSHLMRLFVYHEVMRRIGAQYWTRRYEPAELVRRAEAGFVVTPVSSLVVLESQKDYDRFGISANTNTLGNAAFKQRGAVPEPQEWLLLILAALLLLVVIRRKSPVVPFGR